MKSVFFLVLLRINAAAAVIHSLKYFYTATSGIPNFPDYVSAGLVDDVQISHCDSFINKSVPKQDWMDKVKKLDPEYWTEQSQNCLDHQQSFKESFRNTRFSKSEGVPILQRMYGCEWDDETGKVSGYEQVGYNGEDFILLDMRTLTWVAPSQQALMTKHKWDREKNYIKYEQEYLPETCVKWLKKYLDLGKNVLRRTVLPSVSLLQKSPSSPVTCHATGFYPNKAMLLWRKDGEELHEDVEGGEVLPNHDGSFQMSVDLHLSSVQPEDWGRYDCVFQLSGVNQDTVTKLDRAVIRSNSGSSAMIGIIVAAVAILALITAGVGVFIYKKKSDKRPPSPVSSPEVMEQLNPSA